MPRAHGHSVACTTAGPLAGLFLVHTRTKLLDLPASCSACRTTTRTHFAPGPPSSSTTRPASRRCPSATTRRSPRWSDPVVRGARRVTTTCTAPRFSSFALAPRPIPRILALIARTHNLQRPLSGGLIRIRPHPIPEPTLPPLLGPVVLQAVIPALSHTPSIPPIPQPIRDFGQSPTQPLAWDEGDHIGRPEGRT